MLNQSICIVSFNSFSLIRFKKELLIELKKKYKIVYTLISDPEPDTKNILTSIGCIPIEINFSRGNLNIIKNVKEIYLLFKQLKEIKPDIILSYYLKPSILTVFAAKLANLKRVYIMIEGLGYYFTDLGKIKIKDRFKNKIVQYILRLLIFSIQFLVNKIIVLNKDDKEDLIKKCFINSRKISIVGGVGINLKEWHFKEIESENISFIYVGRLLFEKGLLEYFEAARTITNKFPHIIFYILGDFEESIGSKLLRNIYLKDDLKKNIIFLGKNNVKFWLSKSSVFVLPSYREGLPRSSMEALATGRPIITTNVPGCKETIIDKWNGVLIKPRNTNSLIIAIEKLIKNPDLIISMSKNSRKLAENRFDVFQLNDLLIGLIENN